MQIKNKSYKGSMVNKKIHYRLENVKTKRKGVFCEERARPISGGSPPCRNSL